MLVTLIRRLDKQLDLSCLVSNCQIQYTLKVLNFAATVGRFLMFVLTILWTLSIILFSVLCAKNIKGTLMQI